MCWCVEGGTRESYPDGEIWADLSDPPEFLRLLDLKIQLRGSAGRTVRVQRDIPLSFCSIPMSLISFNLMPRIGALAYSTAAWTRKGVSKYVSQGV